MLFRSFYFFLLLILFVRFPHQRLPMVFHWSLSDNKSLQVSRTLLSILVDLNKSVVWVVFARPLISKSSSPFAKRLGIVSRAPIITAITVIFIFYSFFCSLAGFKNLSLSFFSLNFLSVVHPDGKVHYSAGCFCWWLSLGLVVWPWLSDLFVFLTHRKFCASHSLERFQCCAFYYYNSFFTSANADGVHWSLSDSKSPTVSRTLPSILAVLYSVVRMVSTRPPTAKSSSPFSNPLITVSKAPITIGIIVICIFHSFFNSQTTSRYLSFFSHSFSFILWSAGTAKSTILQFFFFFFCWLFLGLVFWPRFGDPCVGQSPIGVYVCHFLRQVPGCAYNICSYGQVSISCTFPSVSPYYHYYPWE